MISDSVLFIHGCLVRRPVVGYLNRPEMASNRLCDTSIINTSWGVGQLMCESVKVSSNHFGVIPAARAGQ